jgi:hypothetical protein
MHILFSFNCIYEDRTQCSFKLDCAPNVLENLQRPNVLQTQKLFSEPNRRICQTKEKKLKPEVAQSKSRTGEH